MNNKMVDLHCTIPASLKKKVDAVLKKIVMQQGIPFEVSVKTPNNETVKAIEEARSKQGKLPHFSSAKELIKALEEENG